MKLIVSRGPKFRFINFPDDSLNLEDINVAIDKTLDECNQFNQLFMLNNDLRELREEIVGSLVIETTSRFNCNVPQSE